MTKEQMEQILDRYGLKAKGKFYYRVKMKEPDELEYCIRLAKNFAVGKLALSHVEIFLDYQPREQQPDQNCKYCKGTGIVPAIRNGIEESFHCDGYYCPNDNNYIRWSTGHAKDGWSRIF